MKKLDPTRTGVNADALRESLHRKIVGQDEAIDKIVSVYQMDLAGMCATGRPIGNFLFLGPTGVGKTRLVEAIAESLVGDANAVLKVDCAEFQHSHGIEKLLGSPPGYLGHRETKSVFNQKDLDRHQTDKTKISFVLFDEIEKANDSLWTLLLGIFDKATVTCGDNSKVNFSRCMIFMTSNLGAREMEQAASRGFGFQPAESGRDSRIETAGVNAARKRFSPEFMNRLDVVTTFKPLGDAELRSILDIELAVVQKRVLESTIDKPFVFGLTGAAKRLLIREGTDARYGARHLKRAIERLLVQPLSNLMSTDQIAKGDSIMVGVSGDRLTFSQVEAGLLVSDMAAMKEKLAA